MPKHNPTPVRPGPAHPTATPLPKLLLLPALRWDADPRPALLPPRPGATPVLFGTVAAALAELRRLQAAQPGEAA